MKRRHTSGFRYGHMSFLPCAILATNGPKDGHGIRAMQVRFPDATTAWVSGQDVYESADDLRAAGWEEVGGVEMRKHYER